MSSNQPDLHRYIREELPAVIRMMIELRVRELEMNDGDMSVRIRRAAPENQSAQAAAGRHELPEAHAASEESELPPRGLRVITSPMVGTFYHSEQPGRAPLVSEGATVEPGALIGVIEALQVLTEVESDTRGVVEKILAGDGQPVEYGQALVEVLLDG